jgi:hypothetical protein
LYLNIVGIVRNHQVSPSITRYREGSKKHLDDLVPNSDFLVLHCLGIRSSVLGIGLDYIRKYQCQTYVAYNILVKLVTCLLTRA